MASSFGKRGSALKWDAAAWRHFPDSAGDARFLEELQALRKPPANLGIAKYMDCVRAGALRAYRCKDPLMQEQASHAFWSSLQDKNAPAVLSGDIPALLKSLQEVSTMVAPLDAARWQHGMLETMRIAQRDRPIYRLNTPMQQTLHAMRAWEQNNPTKPPLGTDGAPSWLQAYIAVRLGSGRSNALDTTGLLNRWKDGLQELDAADVVAVAQHLCRDAQVANNPTLREMALLSLGCVADGTQSVEDVCGLFLMAGKILDDAPQEAFDVVQRMHDCVHVYTERFAPAPLLMMLAGRWESDNVLDRWHHLSEPTRREQALKALDFVLECRDQQHMLPGENTVVWRFMEQELRRLRPWDDTLIARVAQGLPPLECCRSIALGLDPDMEMVEAMGEPWLAAWRQLLAHKTTPVEPVAVNDFSDYGMDTP